MDDDDARRARAVVRHARWVATAAGAGIAAHLAMAFASGWMAALAFVMAAACAPCGWAMWRRPSVHAARTLVGMSLAMALLHAAIVLGGAAGPGGHSHGTSVATSASAVSVGASSAGASPAAAQSAHADHDSSALAIVAADFAAALLAAGWLRRVTAGSSGQ